MKRSNDFSMYEYLKARDKGDNRPLISYYNTRISTNAFFEQVDKVANALCALGVGKGDSIALCLPNIPNAIFAFYAANKLGAAVNLIHPLVPSKAMGEMICACRSKVVFVLDMFYQKHKDMLRKLGVICVVCSPSDYLKGAYKVGYNIYAAAKLPRVERGQKTLLFRHFVAVQTRQAETRQHYDGIGEEIAAYIHSGGTTGVPKIAMLSNRAVNECSYSIRTLIGDEVERGESMLMVLPMFHIFGLGVCMHSTLTAGARCLLVPIFNPKRLARLVRREKATYMTGVPSMYEKLIKIKSFGGAYLKQMKYCYCGGDKLKSEIKENFDNLMKKYGSNCRLCEGYGLTEAGVCNVNVEDNARAGSVGTPLGDIRACIVDGNRKPLQAGARGEICLSGDNLMSGYFEDEATTKKVMFEDNEGVTWLATGDYGYMESSGHVFFVDRIKRMFKISGMNVFPAEIEQVVQDNVEGVAKCCAVDFVDGGKTYIKLFVEMRNGEEYSPQIEDDIMQTIRTNLMKYSLPREIECVSKLPLTDIGKVDYNKLKQKENIL